MNSVNQRVAQLVLVSALPLGCHHAQHGSGHITVDAPEVFSRERLVQQRVEERAWLQRKLDEPYTPGFQGIRDARLVQGLMLRGEASFDPLGAARNELAQTQLQTQLSQARAEQLRADNELERLRQAGLSTPAPTAAGGGQGTGAPGQGSTSSGFMTPPAGSGFFADTQNASKFPAAPKGSDAAVTGAQLSSDQRLNDEAAIRSNIRARMLEQDLDDTHDLFGRTLYTLKFDIGVLAGDDCDALASVLCELVKPEALSDGDHDKLYREWVNALRRRITAECIDLESRANTKLTSEERLQLAVFATQRLQTAQVEAELIQHIKAMGFRGLGTWPIAEPQDTLLKQQVRSTYALVANGQIQADPLVHVLIADFVRHRHAALSQLVPMSGYGKVDVGTSEYVVPRVTAHAHAPQEFKDRLAAASEQAQVYTVEPKELAQNISDVAARENILSLAGALSAALPQSGLGLKSYAEYVRRSQELMQSILRKPLIVGLPLGTSSFGWVIGPRFRVSTSGASFGHSAVQYSVQATVAVPAWWQCVKVKTTTGWLSDDGGALGVKKETTHTVRLPADISALTAYLIGNGARDNLKPILDQAGVPRRVGVGRQDLVVRGQDLWRNPEVYLGDQRATRVRLLPDMQGVVAGFDSVNLPPDAKDGLGKLPLRVFTSYGVAEAAEPVEVLAPLQQSAGTITACAALVKPFVDDNNVIFAVPPGCLPESFNAFRVLLTPRPDLGAAQVIDGSQITVGADRVVAAVANPLPSWWSQPSLVEARLEIIRKPGGAPVSVSVPGQYFVRVSQGGLAATLVDTSVQYQGAKPSNDIHVRFPELELAKRAFPGLEEKIRTGGVAVNVSFGGARVAVIPLVPSSNPKELLLNLGDNYKRVAEPTTADQTGSFALSLEVQGDDKATAMLNFSSAATLSVKRLK